MAKENFTCAQADTWYSQIQTWQSGEGAEKTCRPSMQIPSMTQFLWLHRTSLSLVVGGQRVHEAMFRECSARNHECYCWLEPLATGDKWGKEAGWGDLGPFPYCTLMELPT